MPPWCGFLGLTEELSKLCFGIPGCWTQVFPTYNAWNHFLVAEFSGYCSLVPEFYGNYFLVPDFWDLVTFKPLGTCFDNYYITGVIWTL